MIRSAWSSPLSTKSSACRPIVARWCRLRQSNTPLAPQVFRTPTPADTARSCRPGTEPCATTPGPASRTNREAAPTASTASSAGSTQLSSGTRGGGTKLSTGCSGSSVKRISTSPADASAGTAATNASAESASIVRHGSCPSPGSQNTPSPRCTAARAPWTLWCATANKGATARGRLDDLEDTEGCAVRGVDTQGQGHASPELGRGDVGHVGRSTRAESRLKVLRTPRWWPSAAPASRRRPRGPRPGRDGPTWRPAPPPRPCRRR